MYKLKEIDAATDSSVKPGEGPIREIGTGIAG
jgi:hypothetical protein